MRGLPPFAEIVAFEAVARHLSFTRAAAELHLTQSAISHRISRLEKHFRVPLFRRLNPGLELTQAGQALYADSSDILERFARLGSPNERRLRVAAASSLCTWWLAARLPRFMKLRTGLSIDLVPIENEQSVVPHVDVRILWVGGGQDEASQTQMPLCSEHVFPVCSPALLPPERTHVETSALARMPRVHKSAHPAGEWSWQVWFDRLHLKSPRATHELHVADIGIALSAAMQGAGVALARSLLAHDAIDDGRLVIPIGDFTPMVSSKKHVIRWRRDRIDDADVQALTAWLVCEARATTRQVAGWLCCDFSATGRIEGGQDRPSPARMPEG